jgi:hypothetical protein
MSQRSFSNDRYRKGANIGSTRKSAAKAKPVRKQGTIEASRSDSKKKPTGGVEKDWAGLPTSPQIKKWRRAWWVLLLTGIGLIALGWLVPELRADEGVQRIIAGVVLVASMTAVAIDLVVIRRLRRELIASTAKKPSKKEQKHAGEASETADPKDGK